MTDFNFTYPPRLAAWLAQLNEQQLEVAMAGPGQFVIIGGPGSGKTRALTARIARLVADGLDPKYILAMTFTKAAAKEISERLVQLGVKAGRVGTIHSVCNEILGRHASRLINKVELDERKRMPMELKKLLQDMRRGGDLPKYVKPDISVLQRYISDCKATGPCYIYGDPFGLNLYTQEHHYNRALKREREAGLRTADMIEIYRQLEERRAARGLFDYDDMQLWAWMLLTTDEDVRRRLRSNYSVVIIDETQDSTPIQWDIAFYLTGLGSCIKYLDVQLPGSDEEAHNLMVGGDICQCLDPSTLVHTQDGTAFCMGNVWEGKKIAASVKGQAIEQEIIHVGRIQKERQARIILEDGRYLDGSSDHLVFMALPDKAEYYYTYLMHRYGTGYRLGTTRGSKEIKRNALGCRIGLETADRLWLLNAHETAQAAAYEEAELSLRFQIPTNPFRTAGRNIRLGQTELDTLFTIYGRRGSEILELFGLLFDFPTYLAQSNTGTRLVISLLIGGDHRRASEVLVESDILAPQRVRAAIKDSLDIHVTDGRRNCARIRQSFKDGSEAHIFADALRNTASQILQMPVDLRIVLIGAYGPSRSRFLACPLSGLVPGLCVWTQEGQAIKVKELKRYRAHKELVDLQIKRATNYFANGIAVHNSIYSWRSAQPDILLAYSKRPGVTVLKMPVSYRNPTSICHVASEIVKGREWNILGEIIPSVEKAKDLGIRIDLQQFPSPEVESHEVVGFCQELAASETEGLNSCAVLSRLSVALHIAEMECIRQRIPYVLQASGSFSESNDVKAVLAYLRVACVQDPQGSHLRAIINKPFRKIGRHTIKDAEQLVHMNGMSLLDALLSGEVSLHKRQEGALEELRDLLLLLNKVAVKAEDQGPGEAAVEADQAGLSSGPAKMIAEMLDRTDYVDSMRQEEGLYGMDESRLAILGELQRIAVMFKSPLKFLGYMDALAQAVRNARNRGLRIKKDSDKKQQPALTLSTIHRGKGLEWNHIFLVDVVKGRFPHARSENMEEELRLLYVAITRARLDCTVSYSTPIADTDRYLQAVDEAELLSPFIVPMRSALASFKQR